MNELFTRVIQYGHLLRLTKPIGSFLLLWPTLMALWIASNGLPSSRFLFIFITGVFLMRAAGCALNDLADRNFDGYVTRTQQRPLATKKISIAETVFLIAVLLSLAFCLALQLNRYSLGIAFIGAFLTALYPLAKRVTHLPQLVLAVTWNLGILMAFAAVKNSIPWSAWLLYLISCLWTIAYDTQYALADREDDLKIGVKSTAILFGHLDGMMIVSLQGTFLVLLIVLGYLLNLNIYFYLSLLVATAFFGYQYSLIADRIPQNCVKAFLNNQWALLVLFLGLITNYF